VVAPRSVEASLNRTGGLGLGLYIAQQNAIAHGGHLHVISEVGDGATFIVELPLHADAEWPRRKVDRAIPTRNIGYAADATTSLVQRR
jgi:hypothetical protein